MPDLIFDLRRHGGIATRSRLRACGHSPQHIRAAVDGHRVLRVGRSWVALHDANPEAVRAIEVGGILGGESALRSHGIWVSRNDGVCVATARTASRMPPLRESEYRIWCAVSRRQGVWRVDVLEALAQFLPRAGRHDAIATIDSALHRGLISSAQLDGLMERMPRRIRRLRNRVDGAAESGLESVLRTAIRDEGWRVESQVVIAGVGRVDLLIDGWLVIEADGSRWHDGHEATERDRERNAALVLRGYRWHRFGHAQIMRHLDQCIAVIRALLSGALVGATR
ncbi:endonuclease domain-containing protein [Agromyces sp. NPDC056965]|uniref:endonuclease domain-containing protein n=1 Tax=Agromyces sp. NPDC056965 TaxID=3345983 RepID=UPI003637789E